MGVNEIAEKVDNLVNRNLGLYHSSAGRYHSGERPRLACHGATPGYSAETSVECPTITSGNPLSLLLDFRTIIDRVVGQLSSTDAREGSQW
jgi:hypothetical protein